MDKRILNDYIDACAYIRETEAEIRSLKKSRKTVIDMANYVNLDGEKVIASLREKVYKEMGLCR